jgi:isopenicillin N synthase-like dioxygenase
MTRLYSFLTACHSSDAAAKQHLVDQVRTACLEKGFFQLTNHGVAPELQAAVLEQARAFFALPLREKMRTSLSE